MAMLSSPEQQHILLRVHHLIGRSRTMHTQLQTPEISAQHAAISWTPGGWMLRDLGSRNGTWLDGQRLVAGESARLVAGSQIGFGGPERVYGVISDAPPAPSATHQDRVVEGQADYLALPSDDEPEVLISFEPHLGWVATQDAATVPLRDGQILKVHGEDWCISLPEALSQTREKVARGSLSEEVALHFAVSADEEYVELTVVINGVEHRLRPRAYHYVLLLLARARLEEDPQTAPSEQGWLYTHGLVKMLRASRNQLYVSLFRARREFAELGLPETVELIERRTTTQQLRLGIAALHLSSL